MKKHQTKKLRLSRETLQDLESSDVRKVVGGIDGIDISNTSYFTSPSDQCISSCTE